MTEDAEVVPLKPWTLTIVWHAYPENDRIKHTVLTPCVCEPRIRMFDHTAEGGQKGVEVSHNALDGRKL